MKLLVTGGLGFIGSSFIRTVLFSVWESDFAMEKLDVLDIKKHK